MSEQLLVEMSRDIRDVKSHVIDLVRQGAINTQTLVEHERRSTQLEARVNPIEKDYEFRHKLFTFVLGGSSLLGAVIALLTILKLVKDLL